MRIYRVIIRVIFFLSFVGGGISHLVFGRTNPEGYRVYGNTALIPALEDLWESFVMPNIGWLTILLAIFEITVGLGMIPRRFVRPSAAAMIMFLIFITILGYGWQTDGVLEDLLKNRLATLVMILLLVPLLRPTSNELVRTDPVSSSHHPSRKN